MKKLKRIIIYLYEKIGRIIPDKLYLKVLYLMYFKKKLDLKNPKSFNEKLQWLKLYNRKNELTNLVDKYEVRKYVKDKIGSEYLIPLIGVWKNFDEINFNELPDKFVLKCNHDSGGISICKTKKDFNKNIARKKLKKSLENNFYYRYREWPYKNIKKKIIAEVFLEDVEKKELLDYKFMCFNGKVKCSFVCSDRDKGDLKVNFFDKNWKEMPFTRVYKKSEKEIDKPRNYKKMIQLCEKLSEEFPFVRVDLYEVNNRIYFGELTFFPGSGFEKFQPEEYDYILGDWIKLDKLNKKI